MAYHYSALHNTLINDGIDDTDDRVIQDGEHLRVRMTAMDSTQLAIAGSVTTVDDSDNDRSREAYDYAKAELSSRWKGGLQDGDRVRIGDRDLVVSGRNPTTGKIQLSDASAHDAEARQNMYDEYDNDIQSRYLNNTRDAVAEAGATGPLSDEQRVETRDEMYASYDDSISNAWRK